MLTIEERTFLVEWVFRARNKYTDTVKQKFSETFPITVVPHRDTVRDLIRKFRNTGSVEDAARSGRPTVLSDETLSNISDKLLASPSKSLRKLSQETEISLGSAHTAVKKKLNFFPYKVLAIQELKTTDPAKRIHYCHWFQNFVAEKGIEVLDECFYTDEAWFHLSGHINSQNTRLWSTENPHATHEQPLHPEKVGVWIAISRKRIVGPIFFEDTINTERYCSNIVYPFVGQLTESEINNAYFQQDGATAHTSRITMALLQEFFGERIISKGLWPPRSPDLTPPDFFFWGASKGSVYKNRPKTINELKDAIITFTRSIPRQTLQDVFQNMCRRVNLCIQSEGRHFQHLL